MKYLTTTLAVGVMMLVAACDVNTTSTIDPAAKTTTPTNTGGDTTTKGDDTDKDQDTTVADAAAIARHDASMTIIQNHCAGCHSGMNSLQDSDFQYGGYVRPGQPTDSELYTQLKGTQGSGAHDMPRNAAALSSAELATLKDWITQMKAQTTE